MVEKTTPEMKQEELEQTTERRWYYLSILVGQVACTYSSYIFSSGAARSILSQMIAFRNVKFSLQEQKLLSVENCSKAWLISCI